MMIQTPAQAMSNRTARLVAEARKPAYSTVTPVREHKVMVEVEADTGYRQWVSAAEADELIATGFYFWSDSDCSSKCWCQK